ncbi:Sec-independent protein translocase protein TatB [Acinetobacter sp. YH12239]|uniref:Sec-independent protein translocase protein TatB n=1 Tax=Acinetobacter sp. YH12239 TaxID=2601166 RepID=UPI0015D3F9A1
MLNIGMAELLMFGIIALLVLGPEKLPEGARFAGKWYGKIKRMVSNVQNDIDRELRMSELKEQMQTEMKRIQELEEKMKAQMQEIEKHTVLSDEYLNPPIHQQVRSETSPVYVYLNVQQSTAVPFKGHAVAKQSSISIQNSAQHNKPYVVLAEAV